MRTKIFTAIVAVALVVGPVAVARAAPTCRPEQTYDPVGGSYTFPVGTNNTFTLSITNTCDTAIPDLRVVVLYDVAGISIGAAKGGGAFEISCTNHRKRGKILCQPTYLGTPFEPGDTLDFTFLFVRVNQVGGPFAMSIKVHDGARTIKASRQDYQLSGS